MVIIITGSSHVGKTLLAQKLLEKYKYPYMSIDHLKMGLIRSGNTNLTPEEDDKLTDYLWPIIREIIKTAIENEQNLIVEGCYVPSNWRSSFDEMYQASIQFICLAMTEDYIDKHYNDIIKHESDIESRMIEADCTKEELKQCNRWFIETFAQAGEKIVIITEDFEEVIAGLIMEQIVFVWTDGNNTDFHRFYLKTEEYYNSIVGGSENRTAFMPHNLSEQISDVVIAYFGKTAIGCAGLKRYSESDVEIKRVWVEPEYRGQHIASQMMKMLEEKGKEEGYKRMILQTRPLMSEAVRLYKKRGYLLINNYPPYDKLDGAICMALDL